MIVAAFHRGIGPPQEMTRRSVAVENFALNFDQRFLWIQRKTGHDLQTAHRLNFPQPNRFAAVILLANRHIHRHKRRWAVVLRPVKFNSAGDPRPN